ncbi:ROK family transcriptional regulator [Agrococcus sp. ProA11]|uniref:ROK family transcriptional regulator n=1 Tax=Agrococcus chionoecetis TaxID=3153752 RepID=UPI00326143C1
MTTESLPGHALRPTAKRLPGQARAHNLSLVLQTLWRKGSRSRADIARATGLTRVTVSDLVAELMSNGLIVELGTREDIRPGKPATLLGLDRDAFQIIGVDLSASEQFRGAVLDLDGTVLTTIEAPLDAVTGDAAVAKVMTLVADLLAETTAPVLGIGIGSPGVVDASGVVLSAPNLGWTRLDLQAQTSARFDHPVMVANDANVAALAEHSFGGADADFMIIKVGLGVGAGLLLGGQLLRGSRFASGEIGHVVVGTDGGDRCVCGKDGCLETWLAVPRLAAKLEHATASAADDVLEQAGRRLGIAMAPIVGALNLAEIVLSGPTALLDGVLASAALASIRERTMAEFHGALTLRMTELGDDIVTRGAAAMVLSRELGVS